MILELFLHRGLGMYIDGEEPAVSNWSFGGDECGHENGIRCHERLGSDRGVPIGPHRVLGWDFDIRYEDFMEGESPQRIDLITEDGTTALVVTDVINADPDSDEYDHDEGGMTITLANGKTRIIDEMVTYVRAATP